MALPTRGQITKKKKEEILPSTAPKDTGYTPSARAEWSKEHGNYVPSTPPAPPKPPTLTPGKTGGFGGISGEIRDMLPSKDITASSPTPSMHSEILDVQDYVPGGTTPSRQSASPSGGTVSRGLPSGTQRAETAFAPTYSSQQYDYRDWIPPTGEYPAGSTIGQVVNDWSSIYKSELANLRDEELAVAARLNDQFMRHIDSLIADYKQYYEQMGQGVDPATEAALARLKKEMEDDQRSILEYMNARGIAQSGMTVDAYGRLAGAYTDEKYRMIAGRLSDLQNQFLAAMQNFMHQKIQGMGGYMENVMGAQKGYTTGMQNVMQNRMSMDFAAWQQQQAERAAMEQAMIPYTQGMTPYQQASLNMQRQQQTTAQRQTDTQNLEAKLYNSARAIVQEAESNGIDGSTHLNNWFDKHSGEMVQNFGYSKYIQLRQQITNMMYPQQDPYGNLFR